MPWGSAEGPLPFALGDKERERFGVQVFHVALSPGVVGDAQKLVKDQVEEVPSIRKGFKGTLLWPSSI